MLGAMKVLAGLLTIALLACSAKSPLESAVAAQILNSDISWDGNYFGLTPKVNGMASKQLLAIGVKAEPSLVAALDDPERYAAAHVLLTQLQMNRGRKVEFSSSHWNHLRVELSPDGTVRLHPEQRSELKAFWRKELGHGA